MCICQNIQNKIFSNKINNTYSSNIYIYINTYVIIVFIITLIYNIYIYVLSHYIIFISIFLYMVSPQLFNWIVPNYMSIKYFLGSPHLQIVWCCYLATPIIFLLSHCKRREWDYYVATPIIGYPNNLCIISLIVASRIHNKSQYLHRCQIHPSSLMILYHYITLKW